MNRQHIFGDAFCWVRFNFLQEGGAPGLEQCPMFNEDERLTIGAPTCQPKTKFKERRSDFNGQKVSLLNPDHLKQYYQELKSRNENVDNFLQKSFKSRLSTILDFLMVDLNI